MESEPSACHCDVRLKRAIKGKVMTQHAVIAVISSYGCPPVRAERIREKKPQIDLYDPIRANSYLPTVGSLNRTG